MAILHGARMVFAQGTESGRAWAEAKITSLTGGDAISARYMRQDIFTFTPKFKLLISGNHIPKLKNVDEAMRRRLYLLPFSQTFKGKKRDSHFAETLLHEFEGILQRVFDGATAHEDQGLAPPAVVREATRLYFEEEDIFDLWLSECFLLGVNAHANPIDLFNSYRCFTEQMEELTETDRAFRQRLKKAGFIRGSSSAKGGRYWQGLKLR